MAGSRKSYYIDRGDNTYVCLFCVVTLHTVEGVFLSFLIAYVGIWLTVRCGGFLEAVA